MKLGDLINLLPNDQPVKIESAKTWNTLGVFDEAEFTDPALLEKEVTEIIPYIGAFYGNSCAWLGIYVKD